MTSHEMAVREKLKRIGYAKGNRVRIYGQEFNLVSDPVPMQMRTIGSGIRMRMVSPDRTSTPSTKITFPW